MAGRRAWLARQCRCTTGEKHPRGLLQAFGDDPKHDRESARPGADERIAQLLERYLDDDVVVLHQRRIPRSPANIDHIAIARSGIWVIDSERYRGKIAISKPLFGQTKLTIAGRDKTKLVENLVKQVAAAEAVMPDIAPGVPVWGALCFVDAAVPVFGKLTFNGYPLLHPKPLAKRINADGPLTLERVRAVATEMDRRFPSA
jgi:hypothetical protein